MACRYYMVYNQHRPNNRPQTTKREQNDLDEAKIHL